MGATRPVTDETFEAEVLQSTRTVLADYRAERYGLSKMIAPILEAIAEEHGDKLGIAKLNVDENPQVTQKYNILNIATWRRIRVVASALRRERRASGLRNAIGA
jgi:thioredoxin 1